jgi:hypothetical protein
VTLLLAAWLACSGQAPMTRNYALILGGGKTKADAEAVLKKFSAPKELRPAAGYPKLQKSDEVKGLKPGFFVALLGYCDNAGDLENEVRQMWKAQKGSYAREVDAAVPGACPKIDGPKLPPTDEEKKLLEKAQGLEPDFPRAQKIYEELVTLNPGNKDAHQALERIMVLMTD